MKLTDKQRVFCEEYVIDNNATQAAIRAGYSENTAYSIGNENLKKPEIQKYLSELQSDKANDLNIKFEDVVNGVYEIAQTAFKESDKIKAYELTSKLLGFFEKDNSQKNVIIERPLFPYVRDNDSAEEDKETD